MSTWDDEEEDIAIDASIREEFRRGRALGFRAAYDQLYNCMNNAGIVSHMEREAKSYGLVRKDEGLVYDPARVTRSDDE